MATFPQLEYPRYDRDPVVRVTGPLLWEQPFGEVEQPPGDDPLVLVAPSTSQDPAHRMLARRARGPRRRAGAGARHAPTGASPRRPCACPRNARVVDWLSYARTMPRCAAVICHAGHGTVARALASGVPVIGCPAAGDMAENAARLAWAGCGISLPRRLVTPRGIRLAVRKLLAEPALRARARASYGPGPSATTAARWRPRRSSRLARPEAPGVGLEPTTYRLTADRSAD